MKYDEFIEAVQQRGHVDGERAERVTEATLVTLAERLSPAEVEDAGSQLPKRMKEWLRTARPPRPDPFGLDEFKRRVAERAGVPESKVANDITAVMTTLREALSGGEFQDVMDQLPDEFWQVVKPTSWRG
jgi:uncharacterized protein (DUF2267 family)